MPTDRPHTPRVVRRSATTAAACVPLLLASCGTVLTHGEGAFPPHVDGKARESAQGTPIATAVPPVPDSGATGAKSPATDPDRAECSLVRAVTTRAAAPKNETGLAVKYGNVRIDDTFDRRTEWFYGQGVEDRFSSIFMTYTIEF